jgi:hypothetical protein
MFTLFSIPKRRSVVCRHRSLSATIVHFVLFACGVAAFGSMPAMAEPSSPEEDAIRKAFANLQAAVKVKDADKLWALLSTRSRADAERVAKTLREAYLEAGTDEKAKQ